MHVFLSYLAFSLQDIGGPKTSTESVLSTTVSEDIGSIRICGIATFNGADAANATIVVTVGTQPGTANGKYNLHGCSVNAVQLRVQLWWHA